MNVRNKVPELQARLSHAAKQSLDNISEAEAQRSYEGKSEDPQQDTC